MANKPTVTIELDLDGHLVEHYQRPDGEYDSGPITLEEVVINRAARLLMKRFEGDTDIRREIRRQATAAIGTAVDARITAAMEAWMAEPRTPTDAWGNPKGEPITFGELVEAKVRTALETSKRATDRDPGGTVLEQAIRAEVAGTVKKEVQAAVAAQREVIVAEVTGKAAEVLTEAVRRAVR